MSKERIYDVGYRRPPAKTRFEKGRSGNPKGRRKGLRNIKTEIAELVKTPVSVTSNGRTKKVPALIALLRSQLALALQGDARAAKFVMETVERYGGLDFKAEVNADIGAPELTALSTFAKIRGIDPSLIFSRDPITKDTFTSDDETP